MDRRTTAWIATAAASAALVAGTGAVLALQSDPKPPTVQLDTVNTTVDTSLVTTTVTDAPTTTVDVTVTTTAAVAAPTAPTTQFVAPTTSEAPTASSVVGAVCGYDGQWHTLPANPDGSCPAPPPTEPRLPPPTAPSIP